MQKQLMIEQEAVQFPLDDLKQRLFKDLSEVRSFLIQQSKRIGIQKGNSWFKLTNEEGDLTVFRCIQSKICPCVLKFQYEEGQGIQGFRLFQMVNKHYHQSKVINQQQKQALEQIKSHPFLDGKIIGFNLSEPSEPIDKSITYILQFAGSCTTNPGLAAIAYTVKKPGCDKEILKSKNRVGQRTNNQAEFIGFIWGALDCLENGIQKLQAFTNNSTVVFSMSRDGKIKSLNLEDVWKSSKLIESRFKQLTVSYKKRQKNDKVALMCRQCLKSD